MTQLGSGRAGIRSHTSASLPMPGVLHRGEETDRCQGRRPGGESPAPSAHFPEHAHHLWQNPWSSDSGLSCRRAVGLPGPLSRVKNSRGKGCDDKFQTSSAGHSLPSQLEGWRLLSITPFGWLPGSPSVPGRGCKLTSSTGDTAEPSSLVSPLAPRRGSACCWVTAQPADAPTAFLAGHQEGMWA